MNQQQLQFNGFNQQVPVPTKGACGSAGWTATATATCRAEFLGTRAGFDAMDTDKDGLMSLAEAEDTTRRCAGRREEETLFAASGRRYSCVKLLACCFWNERDIAYFLPRSVNLMSLYSTRIFG